MKRTEAANVKELPREVMENKGGRKRVILLSKGIGSTLAILRAVNFSSQNPSVSHAKLPRLKRSGINRLPSVFSQYVYLV